MELRNPRIRMDEESVEMKNAIQKPGASRNYMSVIFRPGHSFWCSWSGHATGSRRWAAALCDAPFFTGETHGGTARAFINEWGFELLSEITLPVEALRALPAHAVGKRVDPGSEIGPAAGSSGSVTHRSVAVPVRGLGAGARTGGSPQLRACFGRAHSAILQRSAVVWAYGSQESRGSILAPLLQTEPRKGR